MRCLDIYNQLKNPMDDDEVINQITETYENNKDIYSGLTRVVNKDYEFQISKEGKINFMLIYIMFGKIIF